MNTDIIVEPDIYEPKFEENVYQDFIPFDFKNGIKCPCCTRRDHFYKSRQQFKQHITTIRHKKWLSHLNNNRVNYYSQSLKYADIIKNQKIYIAKLELQIKHLELEKLKNVTPKIIPTCDNLLNLDF